MSQKNKKVYLPNGEEAELLAQYRDGNKIEYVVKVPVGEYSYGEYSGEEDSELIYEKRIVPNVYEKYEDIPMFLRKTELESQVEELEKNIKELKEQEKNLTKKLKSAYNPKFPIGTPIYYTYWGDEVEELKIIRIGFTEEKDKSFYTYCLNKFVAPVGEEEIGNGYYLTREEAEKARQEYLKNAEIKNRKRIEENYKRAKEGYEKIFGKED